MKTEINIIELFSGIGGFSKGIEEAGFKINKHYFSEIDKHAIANYKYNFPNAEFIGDVKSIQSGDFTGIDIITFGSPCQDFSLAGKRKGLEGDRSSLIEYAIRIISDLRPGVFIWENVKGAFSSNSGADFWAILQAFANIGGYRLEWQLLNTKWFLPQNRERIYLVGHLAGRSKPGIFPIGEDNFGINERSIKTRSIRTLTAGGNSGGLHSSMTLVCDSGKSKQLEKREIMPPLRANTGEGHGNYLIDKNGRNISTDECVSGTIDANYHKGPESNFGATLLARARADGSGQPVIVQKPRGNNKGNDFKDCPTISANSFEHNNHVNNIRRLTEIECERLQGFPDDWTKFGKYDGKVKEIPKTQRYKMCGNAVTVAVVKAVVSKIQLI